MWVFPKIVVKPPKWMVKIMEHPELKVDDWGGKSTIFGKHPWSFQSSKVEKKKKNVKNEKKMSFLAILEMFLANIYMFI